MRLRLAWIERGADGPETARIHTADQVATMLVDHLGSPIAEVNDAEQIQQFIYSPWGTLQNPKETENLHLNLIGYMGLPNDSARGLVFTGARAYLPEIGRFVSPDPANVALGANPYAYANNNPLTYYDRDGFAPTSPFDPSSMSKNELRKLRLQHQIIRILKVQPLDSAYSNILVDTLQRGLATNADLVPVVTSFRGFPGETRRGGARRVGSRLIGGVLHDRFEIVIDPNKVVGVHSQISTLAHEVRHTFQDYSRPYTVLSEVQPHLDQWVLANHSRGIPAGTQHDRLMQMFSNLEANYTHLGEVFDPLESPRRETRFGQPTTVYRTPKPEVVAEVVERFRELRPGLVTPHSGPIELAGPHPSVNSAANRLRHLQTRGGPPTVQPAAANAASAASATRPSGPSRTTGQANAGRSPGVSKLPASNPSIGETPRPATSGARPTAERGGTIRSSQPGRATPPRSPSEASGTRSSPGRSATSARPGPSASAKAPYRTVPVTGGRSSPTSTRGGRASATTSPKPQIGRTQRPTNLNHANRRTVRTRPPVRPTAIDPPGAGRPFAAVALSWGFRAIFAYTLFDIGRRVVTGRSTPGQGALDLVNLVVPVRDYLDGRLTLSETVAFATGGALIMLGSTTAVTIGAVLIAPILGKIIGNALAALVINEIRSNSPLG
ncbi:MAG: hypothetical protein KDA45_13605, partial [Planctomycetales bacterium]|nr:hypothetical protein [Planctomycetales bacterium]